MSGTPLRIANVGAEEGERANTPRAARNMGALWALLFDPPVALEPLPGSGCAVAWLNTPEAEAEAAAHDLHLAGADPACVATVHDKAFALRAAEEAGLVPPCLDGLCAAFDPDTLRDAKAIQTLQRHIDAWPAWAREQFTLKPRFGSSGRGRVAGRDGDVDSDALRGALPRLAERGGALLEPWLTRSEDLSVAFWLERGAPVRLLGSTAQRTEASGLYRGAQVTVDNRGRIGAPSARDEAARDLALPLALAADAAGYQGPLGVDLFAFRTPDGDSALRVSEVNARYTAGIVTIGLARRALPTLRERHGLEPGRLAHAALRLDGTVSPPPGVAVEHPLGQASSDAPVFLLARTPELLESEPVSPTP